MYNCKCEIGFLQKREVLWTQSRRLFGRRVIYTDAAYVHAGNVVDVLRRAYMVHLVNQAEIDYLYRYYKGDQPVLYRAKDVRPEICNRIVENRANEIVAFKTGYHLGEPVQYVSRTDDEGITSEILKLNNYMLSEGKPAKDKALDDWAHICGTAFRMTLPDAAANVEEDEAPFEIFTLDPRCTFVVYSSDLGNKPMMGVRYASREDGTQIFSCYTADGYYEVSGEWALRAAESQILGVPIVEYPANNVRMGAFEPVIPLLDAINLTESNRLDGVEQFIQALMLFHNVDISAEDFGELKDLGAVKYKDIDPQLKAEITYLTAEMNQAQTQVLVDSMYNIVLTICGMPNRNGGSSTSDTGAAVIMRDGWSAAEARAKDSDLMFAQSEAEFLKLALRICRDMAGLSLKPSALKIQFTRRNYENISEKVNVLVAMLGNDKIAPELAFTHCGLFSDPQLAYRMSMDYAEKQEKKREKEAALLGNTGGSENGADRGDGSGD